jgi:hypothetical protein
MQEFKFGDTVKDKITGFSGTVTGKCTYMHGYYQLLVKAPVTGLGAKPESVWIVVSRLEKRGARHHDL